MSFLCSLRTLCNQSVHSRIGPYLIPRPLYHILLVLTEIKGRFLKQMFFFALVSVLWKGVNFLVLFALCGSVLKTPSLMVLKKTEKAKKNN